MKHAQNPGEVSPLCLSIQMYVLYSHILEYIKEYESINPCYDPNKDFFMIKLNEEHSAYDKLATRIMSLKRVEGCCKTIDQSLKTENLKTVMDLMKFSIGSTIPMSPQYGNLKFAKRNNNLPVLQLTQMLRELLQNR